MIAEEQGDLIKQTQWWRWDSNPTCPSSELWVFGALSLLPLGRSFYFSRLAPYCPFLSTPCLGNTSLDFQEVLQAFQRH